MASPAATTDVKDDLQLRIRCLLDKSKSELQTIWREEEYSDFEPVAKADLLAALLHRFVRGTSDLDSAQSQPPSSRSPLASTTNTPTHTKSFKQAVISPAKSPSTASNCNNFEKRLAEAELLIKEHKQKFEELDRQNEALERKARQLNVIVYNVPQAAEEDDEGLQAIESLLDTCMPDWCNDPERDEATVERLGTYCPDQKKPSPIRMKF
ncbi:hypothetical protein ABBQ38_000716 [Trebouxia sp. C0009 RCD-2024]